MKFIDAWVRNLFVLFVIGVVLFLMFPREMKEIFGVFGAIFGPLAIIMLLVAALPRNGRKRR